MSRTSARTGENDVFSYIFELGVSNLVDGSVFVFSREERRGSLSKQNQTNVEPMNSRGSSSFLLFFARIPIIVQAAA